MPVLIVRFLGHNKIVEIGVLGQFLTTAPDRIKGLVLFEVDV
jgi:hypothetical protein